MTRHGEIVLVRAVAEGERPALVGPLERLRRAGEPGLALAVGVSTPHHLATLGAAYREASLALRPSGTAASVAGRPAAFDYLTMREDDVARRLVDPESPGSCRRPRARRAAHPHAPGLCGRPT